MVVVFGTFMLSPDRMIAQFELGLAVAILVDAGIVRFTTLPAIMQLLGRRAWWLPRGARPGATSRGTGAGKDGGWSPDELAERARAPM